MSDDWPEATPNTAYIRGELAEPITVPYVNGRVTIPVAGLWRIGPDGATLLEPGPPPDA